MDTILFVTCALMATGLLGCFVPLLPGPRFIFFGALYYGWQTNYQGIGPLLLGILLILVLIGSTADLWMGFLGAKKGGASGWSQLASLVGGFIGMLVFSLPGMLLGSVGAILLVEWLRLRDWKAMLRAGKGYLTGYLLAMVVELAAGLLMIALFALRLCFA
jgi:uncharacterized protein YqgC (DUF456 family)